MASGPTMDNKSQWLQQLCKLFCNLDREVIQSVFESCQFDVERTQLFLYDMTWEDTKAIITTPVRYPPHNSPWQGSSAQYDHLSRVVALIRDGCKILILMRGLPGSGKSTLASLLLKEGLGQVFHDEFIFSTDDYFKKSGHYTYDPTQLEEAHRWNQRRCFSNMKKAVSPIIIDNTNIQSWEMRVYCVMAVQYGYIVEIMELNTPWALNPNALAIRNSHGVDKKKIGEMKTRYQQNLIVADLFKEFCLQYTVQIPQKRKYPLLPTPQPIPMSTDIVDKPKKKETKVPVEYVHKFKTRHDDSPDKVRACADADQLLDIGNERKQKETNSEDLITFLKEHNVTSPAEDSSLMKPSAVEQTLCFTKQMEENQKIMSQMMQLLLNAKQEGNGSVTMSESKMEVDQEALFQPVLHATENKTNYILPSGKRLTDLEEENKKLREVLNSKSILDRAKANAPLSLLTNTSEETEEKQMQRSRLEMYFNHVKAVKSDLPRMSFHTQFLDSLENKK